MNIAVIFPGQGAQSSGMGKDFFDVYDCVKEMFSSAKKNSIYGKDYASLCFNGADEELQSTINTQPAIYIINCIIYKLLKEKNIIPVITGGHSLGEYSALYAAGVFDFETGLQLIEKRAQFMDECAKQSAGTMAAVMGLEESRLIELCKTSNGIAAPAGYNSPGQIVISGDIQAIKNVIEKCKEISGTKCIELKVSGGWHSGQMRKAQEKLAVELEKIELKKPVIPVVSNYSASAENEPHSIRTALIKQLCEPVRWVQSVEYMIKQYSITKFVEAGPGKVLTGLIKRINKTAAFANINSVQAFEDFIKIYN